MPATSPVPAAPPPEIATRPARWCRWLICGTLFLGTFLLFSRALNFDFLDYDDPDYVTQNPRVQAGLVWRSVGWAFTTHQVGNWHPLTWLSHMLDWQLFGANPTGHHAVNIFLHALNAVLALLALRKLTGAFWTSAAGAALFAWHPLRVESVAWIAERKDVLSGGFFLLTLLLYAHYVEASRAGSQRRPYFYLAMLLSFAGGLMSKPMLVTLPFILLLLDFWPLRRVAIAEKIPLFILSAASAAITFFAQKTSGAVVASLSLSDCLSNAVVSGPRYLGKFFYPFNLAACYPRPAHWPVIGVAGALGLMLGLTLLAVWQWRRRPWLVVGWLWFLGMLVPVIGFVPVGPQSLADRYTYLPILGWQLALLWSLREFTIRSAARRVVVVVVGLVLAGGAMRTWNQLACWKNSRALYEHALAGTSDNYLAHCYLGTTLYNEGKIAAAETQCRSALAIKPDYAAANYGLGACLEKQQRPDEALASYHAAVRLQPHYAQAQQQIGAILLDRNQLAEAREHFLAALQSRADFAPGHLGLGLVAEELNHPQEAIAQYQAAVAIAPNNAQAHFFLGNTLAATGQLAAALGHWEQAWRLKPDYPGLAETIADARHNLGK